MALKDMFRKKYTTNCWCNNCSTHQEVQIPRGVSVAQFVESGTGKCGNCGCNTLIADYNQIDEFKQTPARQHQQRQPRQPRQPRQQEVRKKTLLPVEPLRKAPLPRRRPSNRPANLPQPPKKPVEPDTPRGIFRDDVDFWTGYPKGREIKEHEDY